MPEQNDEEDNKKKDEEKREFDRLASDHALLHHAKAIKEHYQARLRADAGQNFFNQLHSDSNKVEGDKNRQAEIQQQIDALRKGKDDYVGTMSTILSVATLVSFDFLKKFLEERKARKEGEKSISKAFSTASPYSLEMNDQNQIETAFIFDAKNPNNKAAQEAIKGKFIKTLQDWAKDRNWDVKVENGKISFTDPQKNPITKETFDKAKNDADSGFHIALQKQLGIVKIYDATEELKQANENLAPDLNQGLRI